MSRADLDGRLTAEAEWFLASPIGSPDGSYVRSYRDSSRGPVYGEITAYAVSMACVWYRRTSDARFLERARQSADYLLRTAPAGVRGPIDGRIYTFDTGIFASALLDLFAVTREDRYLTEARRRLDWLLERLSGGSPAPTVPEEGVLPSPDAWPLRRSVHLAKIALPLLKGWRASSEPAFRTFAERLIDWALKLQQPDGRFALDARHNTVTMTHPHCYATEALVYAAWSLDDTRVRAALERAASWLASVQNADGSFERWYGRRGGIVRTRVSDATAQALRVWHITGTHQEHAARAATYLQGMAEHDGGLPNYARVLGPFRWRQRAVCSWPTFFWHHAQSIEFGDADAAEEMF